MPVMGGLFADVRAGLTQADDPLTDTGRSAWCQRGAAAGVDLAVLVLSETLQEQAVIAVVVSDLELLDRRVRTRWISDVQERPGRVEERLREVAEEVATDQAR